MGQDCLGTWEMLPKMCALPGVSALQGLGVTHKMHIYIYIYTHIIHVVILLYLCSSSLSVMRLAFAFRAKGLVYCLHMIYSLNSLQGVT